MPNILIYDIETSHNLIAKFDLREERTPHQNIIQERHIICAAWKELGAKTVHSVSTPTTNDKAVCQQLYKALSQTDAAVAHNGDNFDLRFIEGRMLYHGLPPLPPFAKVDTLKVARRRFRLNSNRLDYLGQYLGLGRKLAVSGDLWLQVLRGNKQAVKELARYNKQDVLLLEKVFLKLRPYVTQRLSRESAVCTKCGSKRTHHRGSLVSKAGVYPRIQCQDCGGWDKGKRREGDAIRDHAGTRHEAISHRSGHNRQK